MLYRHLGVYTGVFRRNHVVVHSNACPLDNDVVVRLAQNAPDNDAFGSVGLRAQNKIAVTRGRESPKKDQISTAQRGLDRSL